MADKQKLQDRELAGAAGGGLSDGTSMCHYCDTCREYRKYESEYFTKKEGCGEIKYYCKKCGHELTYMHE